MRNSLSERFEAKYFKEPNTGCWLWTGAVGADGYGNFGLDDRTTARAHRFSYEIQHGKITHGACVLHHCDTPLCVNPAHLWLGTRADNAADRDAKGRQPKGEKHGRAKLTETQAAHIRLRQMTQRAYAELYGVSQSLASLIQRGKKWQHAKS